MPATQRTIILGAALLALLFSPGGAQIEPGPEPLMRLLGEDLSLPRYAEAYYHPLGGNPVLDAVLGDPLYLPAYGRQVSLALRDAAGADRCEAVCDAVLLAGAMPIEAADYKGWLDTAGLSRVGIPGAAEALGDQNARALARAWQLFLLARELAQDELAKIPAADREWLLAHPEAYFFGEAGGETYRYFTDDTSLQLRVFGMAARMDLRAMARAQRCLAFACDLINSWARHLRRLSGEFRYTVDDPNFRGGRHQGVTLLVAGPGDDLHDRDVDFLLDIGGDDRYRNNAGGTAGARPAAMLMDLAGNDRYEGDFAVQGGGFLGLGSLLDLEGDDLYMSRNFSQGAACLGAGFLVDMAGRDEYVAGTFAQAAALFGSAFLWDRGGTDHYRAEGLAQAASSTLGIAFLLESEGHDRYRCGSPDTRDWTRGAGIGQGGAAGMRNYPWMGRPSFYGGVAFLEDTAGDDDFYCRLFGQGGAYCLGVGVLMNGGGNDRYLCESVGQGASVHLAAGLLVDTGGDDRYESFWGSTGAGGDRGAGIFIDTAGDDVYRGGGHRLGTARKSKALGLFVDLAGNDDYQFDGESCAHLQRPADPENWPRALFLDLGGRDRYPADYDGLGRGDGKSWRFDEAGEGLDTEANTLDPASGLWRLLPRSPRVDFSFDPISGWANAGSYLPLPMVELGDPRDLEDWLGDLDRGSYEGRRLLYEALDLARFRALAAGGGASEHGSLDPLLAELLEDDGGQSQDRLAFAAVWTELDLAVTALPPLLKLLEGGRVEDPYTRRLLLRALGALVVAGEAAGAGEGMAPPPDLVADGAPRARANPADLARGRALLRQLLAQDNNDLCRRSAAESLGRLGSQEDLEALRQAIFDLAPTVRVSIARGLRDSPAPGALGPVRPLLQDQNLYVRRQAALTAISLGHKAAVAILLESLDTPTLDTGENYGKNLYAILGAYLGPELYEEMGTDLERWRAWWQGEGEAFQLGGNAGEGGE